ncbi:PhnD/SsuA/transferrin family substrate-binding protein [Roseovarius sp. EGI FJ00037]|uniref:phosphate/phosphite/phosphonate ABC transporter substrate-binding protein n=1 Tax=Roseovarius TaxID=74030 RepID=UPI0022A8B675|nr:PhnD/SsuA/transferrin family substrate-binding protein [Roseovarius sp. EGI FJ00037]MCZ0812004.1 PhnD/SsuA/transferrin family substrate-binding protein [Roseovarius sp. EGI FJ00037]
MIASLPMYDRPETAAAHDRLWRAIRDQLGDGPAALTRGGDPWQHWQSPDLLLSQTCGYPYRARLHGHVTLVGTPDFGLEGCPPGHYRSLLVVRRDDARREVSAFASAPFAYNEALSQSGWAAPQNMAAAQGYAFVNPVRTGGHRASAQSVAEGRADIAAIDAQTWRMILRYDAFAADLRVIARTPSSPALPYITATRNDPAPLLRALDAAIKSLDAGDRETLGLRAVLPLPAAAYLAVPNPPPPAFETG